MLGSIKKNRTKGGLLLIGCRLPYVAMLGKKEPQSLVILLYS